MKYCVVTKDNTLVQRPSSNPKRLAPLHGLTSLLPELFLPPGRKWSPYGFDVCDLLNLHVGAFTLTQGP
jgi:hypothetical protein